MEDLGQFIIGFIFSWILGTGAKRSADEGVGVAIVVGCVLAVFL